MRSLLALLLFTAASLHAQNLRPWTDYRVILWMGESGQKALTNPALPQRLRELGINRGMIGAGGDASFYKQNGFGHYVENIINEGLCLKYRSKVTNWDKFVTDWAKTRDMASLVRDYPLEDTDWLQRMSDRMKKIAREDAPQAPQLYDLREELAQLGGNEHFEKPTTFTAKLQQPGHVVNLRSGEKLGLVAEFSVPHEPWQPALFAVLAEEPKGDVVAELLK